MFNIATADDKTVVLIDGANIYATVKALGFDIDFSKLYSEITNGCNLLRIYYYTALVELDDDKIMLKPLVDWLSYNNYTVVTKMAKVITNRDGIRRIKGNMDIEIAVDALTLAYNLKSCITDIVLFTGDGDFCYLVGQLQRLGIRVTIVSSLKTQPSYVADELRKAADNFIDIADLREKLEKKRPVYETELSAEEMSGDKVSIGPTSHPDVQD